MCPALTTLHEGHAPVDALCKTFAQESFSDVSLGVENRADEIGVVDRLEDDLDVALQQSRLDEETRLLRERHDDGRVWFAVRVETEARTTNAADHQRDVLEAWQQECAHGGAVTDMLDDRLDWLASLKVDEVAGIFDLPDNATLGGGLSAVPALALGLGLVLELDEALELRRAADTFATHLQEALADGQLGHVGEVVRVLAEEHDAVVAVRVGLALGLEENFLADEQVAQEFSRLPSPGLVLRRIFAEAAKRRISRCWTCQPAAHLLGWSSSQLRSYDIAEVDLLLGGWSILGLASDDDRITGEDLRPAPREEREKCNIV